MGFFSQSPSVTRHTALTSLVPWRSVDSLRLLRMAMKSLTHRVGRARASSIAIVTVLAMLIAPFCGSNCVGLPGCGASSGIIRSGVEDCHHAASSSSGSESSLFSVAGKACNRQELPAAILSAPEKSPLLDETSTFVLSLQVARPIIPVGFDHSGHRGRWDRTGDPPRAELLEITATILRI
jgi:hypothetical protein